MNTPTKIGVAVITAILIAIPSYAFNWSVDIDRRVQDNEAKHEARDRLESQQRELEKERMKRQEANMKEMRDDLKQLLRKTR